MFIFPDTHFFLHFKHPQDIPWADLTSADPIFLIVGRTVQKEIEKHKFEMRGRPQDRARDYAAKLGRAVSSEQPVVLKEQNPRVLLDYRFQRPDGWLPPPDLDGSWNDDMLVADVLAFAALNPSASVAVLTGDPGLMVRLKTFGILPLKLSERGWELPAEKSPQEKELEKLRLENEKLRRSGPTITCGVQQEGLDVTEITLNNIRYPSITQEEIEAIVHEMTSLHPKNDDFSVSIEPALWSPPSQERIERYHQEYDAWLTDLRIFLVDASEKLDEHLVHTNIQIAIQNSGSGPADHAVLMIETIDGFLMFDLDDEEKSGIQAQGAMESFRRPPLPPKSTRTKRSGAHNFGFSSLANLSNLGIASAKSLVPMGTPLMDMSQFAAVARTPRDRHSFYWKERPSPNGDQVWQLECDGFLHQMKPVEFSLNITRGTPDSMRERGVLTVRLFARNLREPFEKRVPIAIKTIDASTREALMELLPK